MTEVRRSARRLWMPWAPTVVLESSFPWMRRLCGAVVSSLALEASAPLCRQTRGSCVCPGIQTPRPGPPAHAHGGGGGAQSVEASGPWSLLPQLSLCPGPRVTRTPQSGPQDHDHQTSPHIPASVSLLYPQRPLHAPLPTWPESSQRPQSSPGFRHNKPHPSPSFLAPARGFAGPSLPPPGPRGRAGGLHPPLLTGGPRPRGLQRPAGGHVARLRQREAERTGPGPSPGPQLPRLRPRPAAGA